MRSTNQLGLFAFFCPERRKAKHEWAPHARWTQAGRALMRMSNADASGTVHAARKASIWGGEIDHAVIGNHDRPVGYRDVLEKDAVGSRVVGRDDRS